MRDAASPPRPAHVAEPRRSQADSQCAALRVQMPARPPRASTAPVSGSSPRVCTAQLASKAVWTDRQTDRRFLCQTSGSYAPRGPHSYGAVTRSGPCRPCPVVCRLWQGDSVRKIKRHLLGATKRGNYAPAPPPCACHIRHLSSGGPTRAFPDVEIALLTPSPPAFQLRKPRS